MSGCRPTSPAHRTIAKGGEKEEVVLCEFNVSFEKEKLCMKLVERMLSLCRRLVRLQYIALMRR